MADTTPTHPDPQALFDFLQRQQDSRHSALPPVARWQPPLCGDMDMRIAGDGTWFYRGSAIGRHAMVKLFSSILKREHNEYFLVTPVEKWRIQVDDAPFIIVDFHRRQAATSGSDASPTNAQALVFTTQVEDEVVLGPHNPLWVEGEATAPRPYIHVRAGLNGLIHRNVYYRLVDLALEQPDSGGVGLWSMGQFFSLEKHTPPHPDTP